MNDLGGRVDTHTVAPRAPCRPIAARAHPISRRSQGGIAAALRSVRRGEARVSDHRLVLQLARLLQRTDPWSLLAISNKATIAVVKSTVLPPAARASTGPLAARSRRRLAGAAERPVATSIARTRLGGRWCRWGVRWMGCPSGRSRLGGQVIFPSRAAAMLEEAAFTNVQTLEGGLDAWAWEAEEEGGVPPLVVDDDGEDALPGAWV